MSLFKRKEVVTPELEISGTEAIRQRLHARWRKVHLSRTALDLNLSLQALESFAQGTGQLPEAAMRALTKEMYPNGNVAFDPVADKLIDTSPPPPPAPIVPEPLKNPNAQVQTAHDAYIAALKAAHGPEPAPLRPEKPEPVRPDPFKRPGFAT